MNSPEDKRKFDIRQWVLVTSWEPLDIYIFSGCYLKMCASDFSLTNLSDAMKHLSNYSVQKNSKANVEEFVLSNEQFTEYIRQTQPNFEWERDLFSNIKDVVFRTLKGVQETVEQKGNCFEVYGFDIIVDEQFAPWVIEVNLSPACAERTAFLTKFLDDMSIDLVGFMEQKVILSNDSWEFQFKERREALARKNQSSGSYLNDESFYEKYDVKYRWVRMEESILEGKAFGIANNAYI